MKERYKNKRFNLSLDSIHYDLTKLLCFHMGRPDSSVKNPYVRAMDTVTDYLDSIYMSKTGKGVGGWRRRKTMFGYEWVKHETKN